MNLITKGLFNGLVTSLFLLPLLFITGEGVAEEASGSVEQMLRDRGWGVINEADGSLTLIPPSSQHSANGAVVETAAEISDNRDSPTDMSALQQRLESTGWDVTTASDGSLVFNWPESGAVQGSAKAVENQSPPQSGLDLDEMRNQLAATGWQSHRTQDGSLVFYQKSAVTEPPPPQEETAQLDLDTIQQKLQATGWAAHRAPDKSLYFYMPQKVTEGVGDTATTPPASNMDDAEGQSVSWGEMTQKLVKSGWRIDKAPDGSTLLFPAPVIAMAPKVEPQQVETPQTGVSVGGDFALPINSWSDAQAISAKWLDLQGSDDLQVGKIRRIFGVHLVSIVEVSKPYALRHQITIRNSDGQVIKIY